MKIRNMFNEKYKYKRLIVLIFSFLFLSVLYYVQLKSNFNWWFLEKKPPLFKQWTGEDRPTLIYVEPPDYWVGDTECANRVLLAAKKMGWNVLPQEEAKGVMPKNLRNAFGIYVNDKLYQASDIISIRNKFPKEVPLFEIHWIPNKEDVKDPSIYLATKDVLPSNVRGILVSSYYPVNYKIESDTVKFMMSWYPTVGATYYQPQPKKLMYSGRMRLSKTLWDKLDNSGYFVVYGFKREWKNYKSYQSYIPPDGKGFVRTINQHGISLILHTKFHLKEGTPSGRIFESAAAAAVIISDKHPFIEREFQDSVLYIDTNRSDVFEQIEAHMKWIKENPEKAKEKARIAHAIFLEKFTLEQQLARLYKHIKEMQKNNKSLES